MDKSSLLSRLALCAALFALGVIALGAFTRLIDAGLGCPDWPGCYGHLKVPLTAQIALQQFPNATFVSYKAWAEMLHRYFVAGLVVFNLVILAVIFGKKMFRVRSNIILAACLLVLIIYQILLGQWTVTLKLLPIVVTQHLLGGFLILLTLWLVYLNNYYRLVSLAQHADFGSGLVRVKALLPWAIIAVVILFLQITLGAWTSTNYASLSCTDFPFCVNTQTLQLSLRAAFNPMLTTGVNYEGGVLPEVVRQTIQMVHRFGALVLTAYLLFFMMFAMPRLKSFPSLMKSLYVVMGLLCIQLCLGISNVIFKLPLLTALAHNIVAALLLLNMVTFIFKLAILGRKGFSV